MTTEQTNVLVFKDQAGEYYLLPQATLEQGRVPAEHKSEVEQFLAEQNDVQGHLAPIAFFFIGMAMEAGAIGFGYMVTDIASGGTGTLNRLNLPSRG